MKYNTNYLPLMLAVFDWAVKYEEPFTIQDLIQGLKPAYGDEKAFNEKRIDYYLQSYLGTCMLDVQNVDFDQDGKIRLKYHITDFGKGRVKHIPMPKH